MLLPLQQGELATTCSAPSNRVFAGSALGRLQGSDLLLLGDQIVAPYRRGSLLQGPMRRILLLRATPKTTPKAAISGGLLPAPRIAAAPSRGHLRRTSHTEGSRARLRARSTGRCGHGMTHACEHGQMWSQVDTRVLSSNRLSLSGSVSR